jgi:hypothetical protein
MSIVLRVALILVSFLTLIFTLKKIRKTQLDIDDAIYWIVSAMLLLIISIFPQLAIWASKLLGIESPANFVFLFVIFVILIKLFNLAIELSILRNRLNRLTQRLGIIFERNDLDIDEKK